MTSLNIITLLLCFALHNFCSGKFMQRIKFGKRTIFFLHLQAVYWQRLTKDEILRSKDMFRVIKAARVYLYTYRTMHNKAINFLHQLNT